MHTVNGYNRVHSCCNGDGGVEVNRVKCPGRLLKRNRANVVMHILNRKTHTSEERRLFSL